MISNLFACVFVVSEDCALSYLVARLIDKRRLKGNVREIASKSPVDTTPSNITTIVTNSSALRINLSVCVYVLGPRAHVDASLDMKLQFCACNCVTELIPVLVFEFDLYNTEVTNSFAPRIRDVDHVRRTACHGDGEGLLGAEGLEAGELPVLAFLAHGHKLGVGELCVAHKGNVLVYLEDLKEFAQHDAALTGDAVGVAVVGEVDGVGDCEDAEAVHRHLEGVVALGLRVNLLDGNVVRRDVLGASSSTGFLNDAVGEREVRHRNIGCLGLEALRELLLLELEVNLYGTFRRLNLDQRPVLCRREEGDVVEKRVLLVVLGLVVGGIVQRLHVSVVVIGGGLRRDGGHDEVNILWEDRWVSEGSRHLDGGVLISERLLGVAFFGLDGVRLLVRLLVGFLDGLLVGLGFGLLLSLFLGLLVLGLLDVGLLVLLLLELGVLGRGLLVGRLGLGLLLLGFSFLLLLFVSLGFLWSLLFGLGLFRLLLVSLGFLWSLLFGLCLFRLLLVLLLLGRRWCGLWLGFGLRLWFGFGLGLGLGDNGKLGALLEDVLVHDVDAVLAGRHLVILAVGVIRHAHNPESVVRTRGELHVPVEGHGDVGRIDVAAGVKQHCVLETQRELRLRRLRGRLRLGFSLLLGLRLSLLCLLRGLFLGLRLLLLGSVVREPACHLLGLHKRQGSRPGRLLLRPQQPLAGHEAQHHGHTDHSAQ